MKLLILIFVITLTGCKCTDCTSPEIFPYKKSKDPQDIGAFLSWDF